MKTKPLLLSVLVLAFLSCKKEDEPKPSSCVESIKTNCVCTAIYAPVCGCNGKTYSSACTAECSSITSYTQGECK